MSERKEGTFVAQFDRQNYSHRGQNLDERYGDITPTDGGFPVADHPGFWPFLGRVARAP